MGPQAIKTYKLVTRGIMMGQPTHTMNKGNMRISPRHPDTKLDTRGRQKRVIDNSESIDDEKRARKKEEGDCTQSLSIFIAPAGRDFEEKFVESPNPTREHTLEEPVVGSDWTK